MRFMITNCLMVLAASIVALALLGHRARGADAPATETFVPPVFTEDFESGELNKNIWDIRIGMSTPTGGHAQGTPAPGAPPVSDVPIGPVPATEPVGEASKGIAITIQHDVVAHGKSALKVHYVGPVRTYSFLIGSHMPASLRNHFFGRAYMMFPVAPSGDHQPLINAGNTGWPLSNFLEIGLRNRLSQVAYMQNAKDIRRAETQVPGPAYPVGRWFCLEWEFNDNPDEMTLWIDGTKAVDAKVPYNGKTANLIKGFDEFGFGYRCWGEVPKGFDVYYDDIALGTGRIGPVK